jgi:hypothetical protein
MGQTEEARRRKIRATLERGYADPKRGAEWRERIRVGRVRAAFDLVAKHKP